MCSIAIQVSVISYTKTWRTLDGSLILKWNL